MCDVCVCVLILISVSYFIGCMFNVYEETKIYSFIYKMKYMSHLISLGRILISVGKVHDNAAKLLLFQPPRDYQRNTNLILPDLDGVLNVGIVRSRGTAVVAWNWNHRKDGSTLRWTNISHQTGKGKSSSSKVPFKVGDMWSFQGGYPPWN